MLPRRAHAIVRTENKRQTASVSPSQELEELSDSEETIRRIIRVRETTYGMQVLEQPEEEEESSVERSPRAAVPWMRRSMEELLTQTSARDRSIKAQRKTLRQEVLKMLTLPGDSLGSISTATPAGTSLVTEDSLEPKIPQIGQMYIRQTCNNQERVKAAILKIEGRNEMLKRELLRALAKARSGSNLVLLLRSASFLVPEALYDVQSGTLRRLSRGPSPDTIAIEAVQQCFRFDGAGFRHVSGWTGEVDAVMRRR